MKEQSTEERLEKFKEVHQKIIEWFKPFYSDKVILGHFTHVILDLQNEARTETKQSILKLIEEMRRETGIGKPAGNLFYNDALSDLAEKIQNL